MSFFKKLGKDSKSSSSNSPSGSPNVIGGSRSLIECGLTGRNVDKVVENLVSSANDTNEAVKQQVRESLLAIGRNQPLLVLNKCSAFLSGNSAIAKNKTHRVIVLGVMSTILDDNKPDLPTEMANMLVVQTVTEIVADKGINSDWQSAACNAVVSLSCLTPSSVAEELLRNIPSSSTVLPHYFILKAFADFAHANPIGFVPHLKEIMTRMLPVLSIVKQDNLRWVFSACLGRFAEAIIQYQANFNQRVNSHLDTAPLVSEADGATIPDIQYDEQGNIIESTLPAISPPVTISPSLYSGGLVVISVQEFAQSMHTALNHLLNEWITSRDSKVRVVVAEAIGNMCAIIDTQQLLALVPKLVLLYLKFLKNEAKSGDQLAITQGLVTLLDVCVRDIPNSLDEHLDSLLTTIHLYICKLPSKSDKPQVMKNCNEMLRCIEILGRKFTDQVLTFLQRNLESKDLDVKVGSLDIIKHIVSRVISEMEPFKGVLISSVKLLVDDPDLRVQKALCQLTAAMAPHDYLQCSGGQLLITCIINNAAITEETKQQFKEKYSKSKSPDMVSPEELQRIADHILSLFVSTLPALDEVLWPFLLEFLGAIKYQPAFVILSKCISELAMRKRQLQAPDFMIDFDKKVNIPKPAVILARLVVMLMTPFARKDQGKYILRCMYALSPTIHPNLPECWQERLPQLKTYLDGSYEEEEEEEEEEHDSGFNQEKWEAKVLTLVSDTIDAIGDDEWTVQIGDALSSHALHYKNDHLLKKGLLTISGLVVKKALLKEFVARGVSAIFENSDHSSDVERLGCARGLGQAAETHTDAVLEELSKVLKPSAKKSLFGSSTKERIYSPEAKATGLLSYGYSCLFIPSKLLTARIEVQIVNNFMPILKEGSTSDVRENGLRALDLIAKSVHASRIKDESFVLKHRDQLIDTVLDLINAPFSSKKGLDIDGQRLIVLGLVAIITLLNLKPRIPADVEKRLLEKTLHFYSIGATSTSPSGDETKNIANLIAAQFNKMLSALLASDTTQKTLTGMLIAIEAWQVVPNPTQRLRAVTSAVHILKDFARSISENRPVNTALDSCGYIVGALMPRITEPNLEVRQGALDGIYLALRIHHFLKQGGASTDMPEYMDKLGPLREELEVSDPSALFVISKQVAGILAQAIEPEHLLPLLDALLLAIGRDPESDAANGACVVLNGLVRVRGAEINETDDVKHYVLKLLEHMPALLTRENTLQGLLHTVRALARHHTLRVINTLLESPMPHSVSVVKSFQIIASDQTLVKQLMEHLLDLVINAQMYEEDNKKGSEVRLCSPLPTSATSALGEIFQIPEMSAIGTEYYSRIVCSLLLRLGIANEATKNQPTQDVINSLKSFFECEEETADTLGKAEKSVANLYTMMSNPTQYSNAIAQIMGHVCTLHPELINEMHQFVIGFMNKAYLGHRIAATAMSAEHLMYSQNDRDLVHSVTNALLGRSGGQENNSVKLHSLRGLANITSQPKEEMHKFVGSIISALLACFDENNEEVVLQSMGSLIKIFNSVDEEYIGPVLINFCTRVAPSFEKSNENIRATSIRLFGTLGRFDNKDGMLHSSLVTQIHINLPAVILHLNDESPQVQKACRVALRKLTPHLGEPEFVSLFDKPSFRDVDDTNDSSSSVLPINFPDFAKDLANKWVHCFPTRVNDMIMALILYFKTPWPSVCSIAALFLGNIISQLSDLDRARVNLEQACSALIGLLSATSPEVRLSAALVLGDLHTA